VASAPIRDKELFMLRTLLVVAIAAGMVAAPLLAPAVEETLNVPHHAQVVLACRSPKAGETASSMKAGSEMVQISGTGTRVCREIAMGTLMAGPDMSNAKTPLDATKAWKGFIQRTVTSPL
jgi:hypothetical protein